MKILYLKLTPVLLSLSLIGINTIGQTTVDSSSYFGDREKLCKTRAPKVEGKMIPKEGGSVTVGGSQVNVAHDCTAGSDITCQVIDCGGKTQLIMVHKD